MRSDLSAMGAGAAMNNPSLMPDESGFSATLKGRFDAYFRDRNLSRKGDAKMFVKVAGGLALSVITYAALFVVPMSPWQFFAAYLLHGLTHLFLLLNVAHD